MGPLVLIGVFCWPCFGGKRPSKIEVIGVLGIYIRLHENHRFMMIYGKSIGIDITSIYGAYVFFGGVEGR